MDVSDWANYKRPDAPATNPKYCYEWAFRDDDRVVVCLWFEEMREDSDGIHQLLDYQERPILRPDLGATHKKRCWSMDRAFRTAYKGNLLVRVIIVDGPKDDKGDRSVKNRSLDAEPWHIARYDEETGTCRLQRGSNPVETANDDTYDDLGFDPELIGSDAAERIRTTSSGVKRDPAVRRAVIKRSRLTCESPGCGAKRDYQGFLDVHHILGVEKSDRTWTCVALCPNCHREAHASPESEAINLRLLEFANRFSPKA